MALLDPATLQAATPHELLGAYEAILVELRRREIVRTSDAPLGQWAEWLARQVLGGELERNSSKSYDLLAPDGRRVQVKARLVRDLARKSERQLSVFRSFDFDDCLVLLFDAAYGVRTAALLGPELVEKHARYRKHVNGSVLFATDEVLGLGVDVTARFAR